MGRSQVFDEGARWGGEALEFEDSGASVGPDNGPPESGVCQVVSMIFILHTVPTYSVNLQSYVEEKKKKSEEDTKWSHSTRVLGTLVFVHHAHTSFNICTDGVSTVPGYQYMQYAVVSTTV